MKGIERRSMKIRLCGILVHEVDRYLDVWIDSHYKHDKNQVVTFIMNVIADVKAQCGGTLPPILQIQADNCIRENKNQYMFALCVVLVGLNFFIEGHLNILLIGYRYEDINQRFSVILSALKQEDIDSLQVLLLLPHL